MLTYEYVNPTARAVPNPRSSAFPSLPAKLTPSRIFFLCALQSRARCGGCLSGLVELPLVPHPAEHLRCRIAMPHLKRARCSVSLRSFCRGLTSRHATYNPASTRRLAAHRPKLSEPTRLEMTTISSPPMLLFSRRPLTILPTACRRPGLRSARNRNLQCRW
jgi:hypothetical protein